MAKLKNLKKSKQTKEYFLRLRFYTQISKNIDILKEIEEDDINGEKIIYNNKSDINLRIYNKYKALFGDDGIKNIYKDRNFEQNIIITYAETDEAILYLNPNKATGVDNLPNTLLNELRTLRNDDIKKYVETIKNLTRVLNDIIRSPVALERVFSSRLICLNKSATQLCNIANIRPISINSILAKLIEFSLLRTIQNHVKTNKLRDKKQLGFVSGIEAEVNIARLRAKIMI